MEFALKIRSWPVAVAGRQCQSLVAAIYMAPINYDPINA
jgi:hypothetical protein